MTRQEEAGATDLNIESATEGSKSKRGPVLKGKQRTWSGQGSAEQGSMRRRKRPRKQVKNTGNCCQNPLQSAVATGSQLVSQAGQALKSGGKKQPDKRPSQSPPLLPVRARRASSEAKIPERKDRVPCHPSRQGQWAAPAPGTSNKTVR